MKFKRIQFPAKTLIVSSTDSRYMAFIPYFLKLWTDRFSIMPDVNGMHALTDAWANPVVVPVKFFAALRFLMVTRYRTVVFLNPNPKADRPLKWAARLLFVKHRAGFAPLKGFSTLNYSLPFNTENHHYVHQLKIFFEYLVGEKITDWKKPELPPTTGKANLPKESYGVIAIDTTDPATEHLTIQLTKFINLSARHLHLMLLIGSSAEKAEQSIPGQDLARHLSQAMTERAVAVTELVMHPNPEQKIAIVREAAWVTGTDAEALNIAALCAVPGLSIFGPLNERVWQPFATRARVLAGDFACRPCTQFPGKITCTNPVAWQCLSGVTGELMTAMLTGMLSRKVPPTTRH
jgi:ADP-heptose:LPS heptosyltransferase